MWLLSVFERHSQFSLVPAHTGLMHIFCQWKNSVLELPQLLLPGYHGCTETPPPGHATLPVTCMMGAPHPSRKKSTKSGCTERQCWAPLAHRAASNSRGVLAAVARDIQESCSRVNSCMQVIYLTPGSTLCKWSSPLLTHRWAPKEQVNARMSLSHCSAPQLVPKGKGICTGTKRSCQSLPFKGHPPWVPRVNNLSKLF